jgi:hypothetical protein
MLALEMIGKIVLCVFITDYLNPILEMLRFWPALEWLIYQLFGVRRRPDHSVKVGESGLRVAPR